MEVFYYELQYKTPATDFLVKVMIENKDSQGYERPTISFEFVMTFSFPPKRIYNSKSFQEWLHNEDKDNLKT